MSRGQILLKRATALVALMLAMALLAACGGLGNIGGVGSGGQVVGEIRDQDGDLITGVDVTVSIGVQSTTTNTGMYELKNVPTGLQTITATADGYNDFSEPINVPSGVYEYHIQMTRASATVTGSVSAPLASVPGGVNAPQLNLWQRAVALLRAPTAHAALTGETPLVGASVVARNWITGEVIAGPVPTDGNGSFILDGIPVGANILIVATLGDVRVTSVIPEVEETQVVDVNTITTLVAEGLGESFGSDQDRLDVDLYEDFMAAVEDWIASKNIDIASIDLRGGQGWIGEKFGSLDLNQEFLELRNEVVPTLGEMAVAKRIVSTLRNLTPSLIAFGAPVVEKAEQAINEKVGPAVASIVDRLSIVAKLVENADLGDFDEEEYTFEDEEGEYSLHVELTDVDGDAVKTVNSTFTINDLVADETIGSGTMKFQKADGRPVDWMELDVSFFETVDEETVEINLVADIEYTWQDSLVGDIRDLKKISITSGTIDSSEEENILTGFGELVAHFDEREEDGTIYVVVSSLQLIDGTIEVEDITIGGNFTYNLNEDLDNYTLTADIAISSEEYADEDFMVEGNLTSNGVALLGVEPETDTDFADTSIHFNGTIQVPGRRQVSISFQGDRSAVYGFELENLSFSDERVTLLGGGSVLATEGKPGEKVLFDTLVMDLNLIHPTDDGDYTFDFALDIKDAGETMTANGVLRSPAGKDLAVIKPKELTGANVEYLHDGRIEIHSLF